MKLALVSDRGEIAEPGVRSALRTALREASRVFPEKADQLTVRFASEPEIRALNQRWRGHDRATDVLSFPAAPAAGAQPGYLGDIAICLAVARQQARRRRHRLEREVALLALHGYLHLLGFDHETDSGEMEAIERRLRRAVLPPRR